MKTGCSRCTKSDFKPKTNWWPRSWCFLGQFAWCNFPTSFKCLNESRQPSFSKCISCQWHSKESVKNIISHIPEHSPRPRLPGGRRLPRRWPRSSPSNRVPAIGHQLRPEAETFGGLQKTLVAGGDGFLKKNSEQSNYVQSKILLFAECSFWDIIKSIV